MGIFIEHYGLFGLFITSVIGSLVFVPFSVEASLAILSKNKKDPSFAVTLTGSDNNPIPLKKVKTIIKGGVSLGGMSGLPPWESESEGIYQEMGIQYIETYKVDVPAGDLKLGILPQNTQQFEYTISMGND